jgi:hypothetical protein
LEANTRLLVAREILHLGRVKARSKTWWCVTRDALPGDKFFLYKPMAGIVLYLEVLGLAQPSQGFCSTYGMGTAEVRILKVFDPPITAKALKRSMETKNQGFVRRNFQGKAFNVDADAAKAILRFSS